MKIDGETAVKKSFGSELEGRESPVAQLLAVALAGAGLSPATHRSTQLPAVSLLLPPIPAMPRRSAGSLVNSWFLCQQPAPARDGNLF